jgi:DnaJ-class molecular chaperone
LASDPYRELGVTRSASADEIRKAFRKLAKANHPDTNPDNKAAEEKFKRVSAAFDIVGDEEKRKKFDAGEIDADGRETMRGAGYGAGGPWGGAGGFSGRPRQGGPDPFEGADFSDILSEMLGGGRGGRGGAGNAGAFGGGFSQRGSDVRAKLEIELEESITGARKRISFSDGRTIDVTIPKNSQDGQTLRLRGQGSPGRAGAGDAFIELAVKPHPIFKRDGDTLVMDLPVTFYDAVLGGRVEAPTPEGPVTLTVPKGSNSGAKLRLKGRGLPDSQGQRGDLFARLIVSMPEEADKELTAFAETWRKQKPYKPKRRA